MDGIKDDQLLEDFVKRQIEKSDEIQAILTKQSLAQVNNPQNVIKFEILKFLRMMSNHY